MDIFDTLRFRHRLQVMVIGQRNKHILKNPFSFHYCTDNSQSPNHVFGSAISPKPITWIIKIYHSGSDFVIPLTFRLDVLIGECRRGILTGFAGLCHTGGLIIAGAGILLEDRLEESICRAGTGATQTGHGLGAGASVSSIVTQSIAPSSLSPSWGQVV